MTGRVKGAVVIGRPIKPGEVRTFKTSDVIPPEVFDAFNAVIAKHWDGKSSRFEQSEVIAAIVKRMPTLSRAHVIERRYLDVEVAYRAADWHVEYDRPGFNETYEPTFTFGRRTRG